MYCSCLFFFSACAATKVTTDKAQASVNQDPFERFNRAAFRFNDKVDQAVLEPAAKAYQRFLPVGAREAVSNAFSNLNEPFNAINNLLQGKVAHALEGVMRFAVNSVFGLFGTIDLASRMGLYSHPQDFGLTLGFWGVPPGPYLVLPFLGPSSMRDAFGTAVYYQVDPVSNFKKVRIRNPAFVLRTLSDRSALQSAIDLTRQVSFDSYSFSRELYKQNRVYSIHGDDASHDEPMLLDDENPKINEKDREEQNEKQKSKA